MPLWLRFADRVEGEVDLRDEIDGEGFEPFHHEGNFRRVALHPELHTVVCPSGDDFAPEFLRSILQVVAKSDVGSEGRQRRLLNSALANPD